MKLIVRSRRPSDPVPRLSFHGYTHLLGRAGDGDQDAIEHLNAWANSPDSNQKGQS